MHNAHVNDLHNPNKKLHKDREKEAPIIYICGAVYLSISNLQKILEALDAFYSDRSDTVISR